MLQADSVNARNIQVNSLSSISVNTGDLTGGSITGGTFKNTNGSFRIDPNGNIVGANITASRIDAASIFQSGYKIKNIDVQVYKVKHGDWCPIPNGFTEQQCTFVPVGYIMTESYFDSNYSYYKNKVPSPWEKRTPYMISESEYEQQKARYIGRCDIYMNGGVKSNVGLIGKRRAVAESNSSSEWSSENNDYYTKSYTYGELYILVIAKQ